jgi:hypothetical protein
MRDAPEMFEKLHAGSFEYNRVVISQDAWNRWSVTSGGDDPRKAGELILKLVSNESAAINGRFCWIDNPLQDPIPSWDDPTDERPWL